MLQAAGGDQLTNYYKRIGFTYLINLIPGTVSHIMYAPINKVIAIGKAARAARAARADAVDADGDANAAAVAVDAAAADTDAAQ